MRPALSRFILWLQTRLDQLDVLRTGCAFGGEVSMIQLFDIFKKTGDRFTWRGTATTLDQAKSTVMRMQDHVSEFLIVNQVTGERTIINPAEQTPNGSRAN